MASSDAPAMTMECTMHVDTAAMLAGIKTRIVAVNTALLERLEAVKKEAKNG